MPLVNKTLLKTGIYEAPQGTLRAHRGRLKSWVDKFRRMKAAGMRIPVCWGHQPDAVPADDDERARKQYWLGAYNAGYLDDLSLTPDGKLDGKLDCPGVELQGDKLVHWVKLPDGRQVRGAIGEVSIAIKDHVDGKGRKWDDSIVHVGLTPLPVAHGHGGFSAALSAAGDACTDPITGFTLSLNHLTRTLSTDEGDDVADDYEDDDKPAKSGDDEGGSEGGSKDYFKEGMEILAKRGLSLPDDTTPENFWERVCVAGHALEAAEEVTGEDMDGDGEAGEDHLDEPADEGATFDGEQPAEEQPPVMMSLASTKDPAARASIKAIERGHKAELLRRIDRLVRRGLKPALAAELRGKVEGYSLGYTLSADGEMVVARKRLDERIGDLELSLPGSHPLKGTRTAREVARPDLREDAEAARKRQERAGDELAELAGARVAR